MGTVHVDGIVLVKMGDYADENGCADNDISSDDNNHFVNNYSPFPPSHQWSIAIVLNSLYFIERKLSTVGVHIKKERWSNISVIANDHLCSHPHPYLVIHSCISHVAVHPDIILVLDNSAVQLLLVSM